MKLALKLFAIVALLAAPMFAAQQDSPLPSRAEFRAKMARARTAVRRDAVTYQHTAYRAKAKAKARYRAAARRGKGKARKHMSRVRRQVRESRHAAI